MRVIDSAELRGIGIVKRPGYERSRVEARVRLGRMLRSFIPSRKPLSCECSGGGCSHAIFNPEVVETMFDVAFEGDVIAAFGDFKNAIGSTFRGTVRRDGPEGFEIDLPDSAAGRAVIDADDSSGVVIRPFLDAEASESEVRPHDDRGSDRSTVPDRSPRGRAERPGVFEGSPSRPDYLGDRQTRRVAGTAPAPLA